MKKTIGLLIIWLSGSLLHFAADLTGRNSFVLLFAPTNESVWEHAKLIFYPLLVLYLIRGIKNDDLLSSSCRALFALAHSMFAMFGIYYFYTCAFGLEHILLLDIFDFMLCTAVGYFILGKNNKLCHNKTAGFIAVILIIMMLMTIWVFTYYPPNLPIFIDNSGF